MKIFDHCHRPKPVTGLKELIGLIRFTTPEEAAEFQEIDERRSELIQKIKSRAANFKRLEG